MTALLYDLLYGLPLCLIVLFAGGSLLGTPQGSMLPIFVALLAFGLCGEVKYWESRLRFVLPGVAVAVGTGIVLVQPVQDRVDYLAQNEWVLWVALAGAACFWIGRRVADLPLLRRLMAVAFLADLLAALFRRVTPDKAVTALELFFLLLCLAEEVQAGWQKSGYTDRKGHLVSIAPFLIGIGLIVFWIPAPAKPFDWAFVVKVMDRAVDRIKLTNRFFHRNSEDYGLVGFPESGSFWGNLRKRTEPVFALGGRNDMGPVVYLTGKVMDDFDGRKWSATYEEAGRDRMLDTLESLCAVTMEEPEYLRNYFWRIDLRIRFEEFNTKYFFTPAKMALGQDKIGDIPYVQRGGDLVAPDKLGYGSEYSVTYYRLNRDNEEVRAFLRGRREITPTVWDQVRRLYDPAETAADNDFEAYQRYVRRMKEYYLPETEASEEIAAYLEKLLQGAESDFDKLERLEKMLSSYEYSAEPGRLPDEVETATDFLDYFMLELRKGYCSHFATAFVLLARSQGIPARYVQGYYVTKGDAYSVMVTTDMAHSWPEAYLDGYGWIAFEPTPGKRQTTSWSFQHKRPPGETQQEVIQEQRDEEEEEIPLPEEVPAEGKEGFRWYVILLPIGFGLLFLGGYLAVERGLSKRWYERLSPGEKFLVTFWRNWQVLIWLGYARRQGETLEEFRGRISEEAALSLAYLEDYEAVIYGGSEADEEMLGRALEAWRTLLELLKERKGKWFWYYFLRISGRNESFLRKRT